MWKFTLKVFYGVREQDSENCQDLVKEVMKNKLSIDEGKADKIMFCAAHRLGRKRHRDMRPRPIIARFTCHADRDNVWWRRTNLRDSPIKMDEDLPPRIREIRGNVLVPALRKIKEDPTIKATIIGDMLLVDGRWYTYNNIPQAWRPDEPPRKSRSPKRWVQIPNTSLIVYRWTIPTAK